MCWAQKAALGCPPAALRVSPRSGKGQFSARHYVKQNSEISVKEHIANVAKNLNDSITVRRFVRYQIGESISA